MFACYEEERLRFIRAAQTNQSSQTKLRQGPLDELRQSASFSDPNETNFLNEQTDETIQGEGGPQPGKMYLPCTFTGGPRYMKVHYQNAMGIVSRLGRPTYFLTFTYSANWEENKNACPNGNNKSDPATACRVFKIKLQELLKDLRSGALFGKSAYIIYVIEMQMRGLPHTQIAFKIKDHEPTQGAEIDCVIRADIPSAEEGGGRIRELVLKHMIHGPCGTNYRTDFLCWDATLGYCTKYFPKPSTQTTHVDERGFVQYKRDYNNTGLIKSRNHEIAVHDGWVVPYNPALLLKYEAHINLELASTRRIIKYLFKYLMKGGSLQNVKIKPLHQQEDEINQYVTKRMVGASDACWRLLDFDISKSEPTVECLPVHLEGKQMLIFKSGQLGNAIANANSKLNVYFERSHDAIFDNLTYQAFLENYIVHTTRPNDPDAFEHPDGRHYITARKRGEKVCRLIWVSPNRGEQYYLRMLLLTIPCRGYEDLLNYYGNRANTFQEVALNLGLITDEDEYEQAFQEVTNCMTGKQLRTFFILLCNMGAPAVILWNKFKNLLCEDYLEIYPTEHAKAINMALIEIDQSLRKQGSSLIDHGLPAVHDDTTELSREQLTYDTLSQAEIVKNWESKLSEDQKRLFDHIRDLLDGTIVEPGSRSIFLDGPGGYGKTQLIKVRLAFVRSRGKVALAVASSGIAARNMPGGTTAHSMFRLSLDLGEGTGVWNLTNGSQRAALIRAAELIVFDEAPMAHRHVIEIIERSLRYLMNSNAPFGGKIFICCGDFRQIPPVVEKARTSIDITAASVKQSPLWNGFKQFSLTRPQRTKDSNSYSEFLLKIGNGTLPEIIVEENSKKESLIPLIGIRHTNSLEDFISDVFPENILKDHEKCSSRAILTPLNVNVKEINNLILNSMDGQLHELRSADTVDKADGNDELEVDNLLLNLATAKGVTDHLLKLKVGAICLIMRNLNIASGLVNGTKVIITAIRPKLITVKIPGKMELYAIPRIIFKFNFVEGSPLRICRRQFPLMLAYCMSGHKSQGQTIDYVGLDLRTDCFTHGQLYVLLSRVRSQQDLIALVPPHRIFSSVAYAKNIVYQDLLI